MMSNYLKQIIHANHIIIDYIIYLIKNPGFLEFISIINKECEEINF